jgi:hypothetical protein
MAQPDKSRVATRYQTGLEAHVRGGLPTARFRAAPIPVTRYFGTGDNDPSFITDIRLAAPSTRPDAPPSP